MGISQSTQPRCGRFQKTLKRSVQQDNQDLWLYFPTRDLESETPLFIAIVLWSIDFRISVTFLLLPNLPPSFSYHVLLGAHMQPEHPRQPA